MCSPPAFSTASRASPTNLYLVSEKSCRRTLDAAKQMKEHTGRKGNNVFESLRKLECVFKNGHLCDVDRGLHRRFVKGNLASRWRLLPSWTCTRCWNITYQEGLPARSELALCIRRGTCPWCLCRPVCAVHSTASLCFRGNTLIFKRKRSIFRAAVGYGMYDFAALPQNPHRSRPCSIIKMEQSLGKHVLTGTRREPQICSHTLFDESIEPVDC